MRGVRAAVHVRRSLYGARRPSWGVELETWATFLHHWAKRSALVPVSFQRWVMNVAPPRTPVTRQLRFERVTAGSVPAEWFRGDGLDDRRVLLYLHGGGYSLGSIDSHRDLIARVCLATGAPALALDYRLAPEHRFPAQLEDARAAYRWLLERGFAPERVVVAGESAGGGLTLSLLVATRDAGDPLPAAAAILSPWVDLEASGTSLEANAPYDYIHKKVLHAYARRFVRPHELRHPLAAPLHAELSGLPPLLVQAGGVEGLLDDARRIAHRAKEAGVKVTLDIAPDMIHAWHVFAGFLPEAQAAIDRTGEFLRSRMK